eukprot:5621415-Prymnesium_polylepis.1
MAWRGMAFRLIVLTALLCPPPDRRLMYARSFCAAVLLSCVEMAFWRRILGVDTHHAPTASTPEQESSSAGVPAVPLEPRMSAAPPPPH